MAGNAAGLLEYCVEYCDPGFGTEESREIVRKVFNETCNVLTKVPRQAHCVGKWYRECKKLFQHARKTNMNTRQVFVTLVEICDKHKIDILHNDIKKDESFNKTKMQGIISDPDFVHTFETNNNMHAMVAAGDNGNGDEKEMHVTVLDEMEYCCDKHAQDLSSELLKRHLWMDGINCCITIYQIIQYREQLKHNTEEFESILENIDQIYQENVHPALEILYNYKKEKFEIAKIHLDNAKSSLNREEKRAISLSKNSKIQSYQSGLLFAQSGINGMSNLFTVGSLIGCGNSWLLGIKSVIGITQTAASMYGLTISIKHFNNWKKLEKLVKQLNLWINDIESALNIIKQFKLNNGIMTDEMEKQLIKIQINQDEQLAKQFEKQEKQRVEQIASDAQLAKKLAKEA